MCNQCESLQDSLNKKLIGIADARLYNIRFGLDRPVYFGLYKAIKFYKQAVKDICKTNGCDLCYGSNIEDIFEKARLISA